MVVADDDAAPRRGIVVLNTGSSGLKFALFGADGAELVRGEVDRLDSAPHLRARDTAGRVVFEKRWNADEAVPLDVVLRFVFEALDEHHEGLAAIGHRVVHGGIEHSAPEIATPALLARLDALTPLDPLHMPGILATIRAVTALRPTVAQVVCFDTGFHRTQPAVATRLAIPRAVADTGVRRFGFHGLSYEYVAGELARIAPALARGRVIVAHLGSGASLCALLDGRSIDTTFGFTALDGLMMATRCGSLDPGVILYLARQGQTFAAIEDMLYRCSGLLGVSGISGDVRVLLASGDPRAAEAIELFTYRVAAQVGALTSALGGLDGLIFTAGIGEHSPAIRAMVCARLGWLGVHLDADANDANAGVIGIAGSRVEVRVIATNEEAMIARHTRAVIARHTRG